MRGDAPEKRPLMRRAWLAAVLSFLWPGAGHLYVGRGLRAAAWMVSPLLALSLIAMATVTPGRFVGIALLVIGSLSNLASAIDAGSLARKTRRDEPQPWFSRW